MITKNCTICGNLKSMKPYLAENFKFCSPRCRGVSMKGFIPWNKGLKYSDELKSKLNITGLELGRTEEVNEKKKGRSVSPHTEFKKGHKLSPSGERHWLWKGGITPINKILRRSNDYRLWRESVYKRDNWTCQECGQRGKELHPHHIKPWSQFPELRLAINNGLTLCAPCHRKTDTWGGKLSLAAGRN